MRVVFVTDLHGSSLAFKKALVATKSFEADLLIVGGDLSGKQLIAIVPTGNDKYLASEPYIKAGEPPSASGAQAGPSSSGVTRTIEREELALYLERLEAKGYYWHIAEESEVRQLNEDPTALLRLCDEKIYNRLVGWSQMANESLEDEVLCVWTGGNDDEQELVDRLRESRLGRFRCGDGAIVEVDGFSILSLGYSNPTPFETCREIPDAEIGKRLRLLFGAVKDPSSLLLNVHVPPKGCGPLDLVLDRERPHQFIHVGSDAVREFIAEAQPLADFAGHIHEARGTALIGRTRVFNPGSEYNAGILLGYAVSLARARIADFAHFSR